MLSKDLRPHASAPAGDQLVLRPVDAIEPADRGLDPAALARLAELDPNGQSRLIERVLRAFQASVARMRPQAEAARDSGDRNAIRLVAHTLKSSSASIGALRLSQLCAQIETAIRLDTDDDLSAPLAALSAALDGALQAIDALLKGKV